MKTTINDLPDELLVEIFSYSPWIEDIVSFSKVCRRWRNCTLYRLKLVKHLIPEPKNKNRFPSANLRTIFYNSKKTDNALLAKFVSLFYSFETLIISADQSLIDLTDLLPNIARIYPGIKRLALPYTPRKNRVLPFNELEALSMPCFFRWFSGIVLWCREYGQTLKQIRVKSIYGRQHELLYPNFINLERLHLTDCRDIHNFSDKFPVLYNVKMLEMEIADECYIDVLLKKFPNMQSMWLHIRKEKKFTEQLSVYPSLENLVMDFDSFLKTDFEFLHRTESIINSIHLVFPNLRKLAIRNRRDLSPDELFSIPSNLPKLEVFDVVGCWHITVASIEAAYEVWNAAGRDIKLYHMKYDKYSTSHIGTDFMRDWFFRDFKNLPIFMEVLD